METVAGNPTEVRLTRRLERLESKLIRIEALLYRILGVRPRNETTRGADQHDEASSGNGEEEESRRHV